MTEISLFLWQKCKSDKEFGWFLNPTFLLQEWSLRPEVIQKELEKTSEISLDVFPIAWETAKILAGKHDQIAMLQIGRKRRSFKWTTKQ